MTKILNTLRVTGTSSTSQALGVTGGYALFNDIRLSKGITYSSGSYSVAVINLTTGRVEMVSVASLGITGSGGSGGGPNYVNPGLSGQVAFYTGATSVSGTSSLYFTQSSILFSGITGVSITNNTTGYLPTSVLDLIPFGGSSTYSAFRVRNSDVSSPDSINVLYNGNVGLGTNDPQTKFHINSTQSGVFRLNDTTEGLGYYLVSDVDGVGTWTQSQQYLFGSGLTSTGEYPVSTVSVDLTPYSGLTLSSGLGLDPGLAGLGLEYLPGSGTSIIGIDSKVKPWSWTDGTTLTIDPDKFDYVYSIETGPYLITIDTSMVEGIDGFQFTLLKKDGDIGVVYTSIPEYDTSVNNSRLTRQNQTIQYKFDLHDLIWNAYILDEGVVPPMTVLANMGTDYAHVEEFPVIDINDTIQKSLNYTEGSFTNDWLSGTIYSCFRQLSIPSGGSSLDLTAGNYIGDTTVPAYSMVQGKSFRIFLTGTVTTTVPTTTILKIKLYMGGIILSNDYTLSTSLTNEPFRLSYEIKIGDVGVSGSVHGSGIFTLQNDQLHLFDNTTWGQGVDTTNSNVIDVVLGSDGDASYEIYHSTIERLA
jgi:hypothetical protein